MIGTLSITLFKKNLLILNLVFLTTAFSTFIGEDGRNYLLIAFMIFSIILSSGHFLKPDKKDWAIYLLPITILITGLLHINSFRLYSYLYGLLFILFYITNINLIRYSKITIVLYEKFIKILVYSFCIVLIVQQLMYLAGIKDFFNRIFSLDFKFNSLATEASYAVTIILILFYSYITLRKKQNNDRYEIIDFKKDKMLWFTFSYLMLTIGSSLGILYYILFLISFMKRPKHIILIIILIITAFLIGLSLDFIPIQRLNSVLYAVDLKSSDYSMLIEADHSAAVRLIPLIMALKTSEFYTLFGMGMDFSANYFPTVIKGVEAGTFGGGLLPSYLIDNGIINTIILFLIIQAKAIHKFINFGFFIFIIILINTSFNSQLFWFVLTILTINKHLMKSFTNDKIIF